MTTDQRTTSTARDAMRQGAVDVLPVIAGVVPFGLVAGVAAVEAGVGVGGALAASSLLFAGASQLAALDLIGRDAPLLVVVLTVLVINLRMTMYSAAMAPLFAHEPLWRRLVAGYFLVDQAFALTVGRAQRPSRPSHHLAYYLGMVGPMWVNWMLMTLVGALLGATIPDWLPLSATVPLVFLVLLVPAVSDRPTATAAVVSGAVATLGAALPANAGLLLGATSGIAAGTLVALADGADGGTP